MGHFSIHHSSLIAHRCIAIGLLVAMVGGCGTVSRRDTTSKAPPATTRGGGYYLDDGPGANPPADLDSIPDAVPRLEPLARGASRPYTVMGRTYTPMTRLAPYKARGIASWYGRRYHGKMTSSGEIYDMYAMTAAHPTLPIPSYARVTNLATGKSVVVRINDRGPFVSDRLIDLSYTAAYKLGVLAGGSAMVEVESILPGETSPPPAVAAAPDRPAPPAAGTSTRVAAHEPEPIANPLPAAEAQPADGSAAPEMTVNSGAGGVFLQLGAFGSKENAENYLTKLRLQIDWLADRLQIFPRDGLYRVHAGPYASRDEARQAADRIGRALGIKPLVLMR